MLFAIASVSLLGALLGLALGLAAIKFAVSVDPVVADIEALEVRLAQSKAQLVALLEDIEAKPDDIDCAANARRVLSRMLGRDVEGPTLEADDTKLLGKTSRRRTANTR